ncbi:hypothetical protein J6590_105415 [Homalodisca vitripennis]|nr:hypothetical protein J6590_105415 [Homalodisca vitripennis]
MGFISSSPSVKALSVNCGPSKRTAARTNTTARERLLNKRYSERTAAEQTQKTQQTKRHSKRTAAEQTLQQRTAAEQTPQRERLLNKRYNETAA